MPTVVTKAPEASGGMPPVVAKPPEASGGMPTVVAKPPEASGGIPTVVVKVSEASGAFPTIVFRFSYSSAISFSQSVAIASLGIRQSPRGERLMEPTFGPSGRQLRLNCCWKKRRKKVWSHFLRVASS